MLVKIKDIGKVITGNTPSKKIDWYWNKNDIPFIKPDCIKDGELTQTLESNEYLSMMAEEKARIVSEPAILVTCIGSIGKVGLNSRNKIAFNQQINAVIPNKNVNPKYLAYNIIANKEKLKSIANAPVVPIINKTQFEDFQINFDFNMEKQQEVILLLDKVMQLMDLRRKQLSVLDDLVKSRFIEMFGDMRDNPNNYPVVPISEIADFWNGLTYKPDDVSDTGIIVLRSSNIQNSVIDLNDIVRVNLNVPDKKMVQENDILMCSRNGSARLVGKVALIDNIEEPMSFGAFMMIIRSDYYPYLKIFFELPYFKEQIPTSATTTINQITGNMLKRVKLPKPPVEMVMEFERFVSQTNKSKFKIQKSLTQLQTLFDSLMQKYFG